MNDQEHADAARLTRAVTRLTSDAKACEFVTTAVHFYGDDKDGLAADIRVVLAALEARGKKVDLLSDRLRKSSGAIKLLANGRSLYSGIISQNDDALK